MEVEEFVKGEFRCFVGRGFAGLCRGREHFENGGAGLGSGSSLGSRSPLGGGFGGLGFEGCSLDPCGELELKGFRTEVLGAEDPGRW